MQAKEHDRRQRDTQHEEKTEKGDTQTEQKKEKKTCEKMKRKEGVRGPRRVDCPLFALILGDHGRDLPEHVLSHTRVRNAEPGTKHPPYVSTRLGLARAQYTTQPEWIRA
eukprot:1775485-Rhodomonas_salina.1